MAVADDKDRIVITITKDVKAQLEQLAGKDNRSLSNYVSNLLQNHVDGKRERD